MQQKNILIVMYGGYWIGIILSFENVADII